MHYIFKIIFIVLMIIFFVKEYPFMLNNFYINIKDIKEPSKIDVLVNKHYRLGKFYKPNDLIKLDEKYSHKDKYLRCEAALSFEDLSEDAMNLGYKIVATSTYRSYDYQEELFNYYIKTLGKKEALKASAKPGHSEHQTGLSVDVLGSNNDYNKFGESKEFDWMIENAHKYGFILRYPKDKENITGFKYEPWHYRYVGKEIAKYIYDNNLTLEEYKKIKDN